MEKETNQMLCRISFFMIWLIVLMPVYSANALEIAFNPSTDLTAVHNGATIVWTTDEPATGRINYGPDGLTDYVESKPAKTEHEVTLTGLASEYTFYYNIVMSNGTGVVTLPPEEGAAYSFTTTEAPDTQPPQKVTGLSAPIIKKDSVTLVWQANTDEDLDHYTVYRDNEPIADNVLETTYTDTGLNTSTTYKYAVSAVDAAGNPSDKVSINVITQSDAYKDITITGVSAEALGTNVRISWTTDVESHSRVKH